MAQTLKDLDNVKTFPSVNVGVSLPAPSSRGGNNGLSTGRKSRESNSGYNQRNVKTGRHQKSAGDKDQRVQLPGLMKVLKPAAVGSRSGSEAVEQVQPLIGFNAAGLKMDTVQSVSAMLSAAQVSSSAPVATLGHVDINKQNTSIAKKKAQDPVTNQLRTYATLMDQFSLHNIIIWNGKALRNTPEFSSFQRTYVEMWSNIVSVISLLETYLGESQVKMAVVSGQKISELAVLNLPYTSKRELMGCVVNEDQVRSQMIRGSGDDEFDKIRAIVRIQNAGRQILAMKSVRVMRLRIAAAVAIQCCIRKCLSKMRVLALAKNSQMDAIWTRNQEKFMSSYGNIQAGESRVIVYLPSIYAAEYLRINMENINVHQNAHVAVFHQLLNPDVNLVYISPEAPSAQLLAFHEKLLLLLGAPEGSIKRLRVITPELSMRLPEHVPIGHALWYSGATLRKIRSICKRFKHAVFVPSAMGYIEKRIANFLDIGTFSPDPVMGGVLSSRSHTKRVFIDANVNVPIGAHDIESEEDLIVALSRLISCNLDVNRWFIRLNNDFNGESLAILDCSKLPVVRSLREEQASLMLASHNNVLVWFEHRVQLNARKRIMGSLHHYKMAMIEIIRQDLYPNFHAYAQRLRHGGCLIEAEPPCSLGYLDCICLLQPKPNLNASFAKQNSAMGDIDENEGECTDKTRQVRRGAVGAFGGVSVRILETHSKLTDEFGLVQGSIYPQPMHIHQESIEGAANAVCNSLWSKIQCIGFVTIRFLASWDHTDQMVRLLGSELSFGMSPLIGAIGSNSALRLMSSSGAITAMMRTGTLQAPTGLRGDSTAIAAADIKDTAFFKFSGTGKTDSSHHFSSPFPVWTPSQRSEGSYLYLPVVYHAPLRSCRDEVFFKLCKLNNIAYDPVHQTGVMFFLVDRVSSGQLSMLIMGGATGGDDTGLVVAESTEGQQYHPPAIKARLSTLQLAVNALSFINRSFGKDSELMEAAGFDGAMPGAVHNSKASDQHAARASNSLSSILLAVKKLLKKEQKIADALSSTMQRRPTR